MAKKTSGFIELYWTCPNCGSENLGSSRICPACGGPQPKNAEFHQAEIQQLISDTEKLNKARSGADIHCGFCGTRNTAEADKCSQCGSDLKEGLTRPSTGKVVGAFQTGGVKSLTCASCGTLNSGNRLKCENCGTALSQKSKEKAFQATPVKIKPSNNRTLGMIVLGILLLCAVIYFLFLRTEQVTAVVVESRWQRSVTIEILGPVEREGWIDEIPDDASGLNCSEQVRSSQTEPPGSGTYNEVCGTPYTVDRGNGFAEVVQDCEYEILKDYCSYLIEDWSPMDTIELSGSGMSARWPEPVVSERQRQGELAEQYVCRFEADSGSYEYTTDSFSLYQQCVTGSVWALDVNAVGGVQAIEPAN